MISFCLPSKVMVETPILTKYAGRRAGNTWSRIAYVVDSTFCAGSAAIQAASDGVRVERYFQITRVFEMKHSERTDGGICQLDLEMGFMPPRKMSEPGP